MDPSTQDVRLRNRLALHGTTLFDRCSMRDNCEGKDKCGK